MEVSSPLLTLKYLRQYYKRKEPFFFLGGGNGLAEKDIW
jgi:hypothetical protein